MDEWEKIENGTTIGTKGSEGGIIIIEEILDGARICLEKDGYTAPYSITMGISYLFFHTHFCSSLEKAESDYKWFKSKLEKLQNLDIKDIDQQDSLLQEITTYGYN